MYYTEYLKNIKHCPFCLLKDNTILEENNNAFITYALAPYHDHHILIIPKRHLTDFDLLTKDEIIDIVELQHKAIFLLEQLGHHDYSLLVRTGDSTGKTIDHTHFHLIPDITLGNIADHSKDRIILEAKETVDLYKEYKKILSLYKK